MGDNMIEKEAMYKIPYGLFMVSVPDGKAKWVYRQYRVYDHGQSQTDYGVS